MPILQAPGTASLPHQAERGLRNLSLGVLGGPSLGARGTPVQLLLTPLPNPNILAWGRVPGRLARKRRLSPLHRGETEAQSREHSQPVAEPGLPWSPRPRSLPPRGPRLQGSSPREKGLRRHPCPPPPGSQSPGPLRRPHPRRCQRPFVVPKAKAAGGSRPCWGRSWTCGASRGGCPRSSSRACPPAAGAPPTPPPPSRPPGPPPPAPKGVPGASGARAAAGPPEVTAAARPHSLPGSRWPSWATERARGLRPAPARAEPGRGGSPPPLPQGQAPWAGLTSDGPRVSGRLRGACLAAGAPSRAREAPSGPATPDS